MSRPFTLAHAKPSAPTTSYWATPNLSRDQLMVLIAARRGQQRSASPSDLTHDPMLAATTALAKDHRPRWEASR